VGERLADEIALCVTRSQCPSMLVAHNEIKHVWHGEGLGSKVPGVMMPDWAFLRERKRTLSFLDRKCQRMPRTSSGYQESKIAVSLL
jgi:hypothetical protein